MNYVITTCTKKQLTDILKRWISNVANFEKVRENSTGKKVRGKKYGGISTGKKYWRIVQKKVREAKSTGNKKYGKKVRTKKYGKKSNAGQGLFRSRDFVTSGEKGPTRADIA
jgi:hypothetical protein